MATCGAPATAKGSSSSGAAHALSRQPRTHNSSHADQPVGANTASPQHTPRHTLRGSDAGGRPQARPPSAAAALPPDAAPPGATPDEGPAPPLPRPPGSVTRTRAGSGAAEPP